jgi:drug/metabolite transporter (DMT)-like permease
MRENGKVWIGLAMASAALFGASTPFAKLLLGNGVDPWLLAGLLYAGSGLGLGAYYLAQHRREGAASERPLRRTDLPWLGLVVLSGGITGPLLLMVGLTRTSASTASLLLNIEGLATMGIAWLVFRENVDRRLLLGALAILAGAVLLSWEGRAEGLGLGAVAIVGACIAWGIDNNLTRKLSGGDPVQIAMIKGLAAGAVNLLLAVGRGATLPPAPTIVMAGFIGLLGYGVSLVLFVLALRHLGTARTGAYFSTAPFIGGSLAIALLGDPLSGPFVAAAVLMGIGVYLHITERHEHVHVHAPLEHEHSHVHDEHHGHDHGADDPEGEPHTHVHRHEPLRHSHPHYPDLHHRHGHSQ